MLAVNTVCVQISHTAPSMKFYHLKERVLCNPLMHLLLSPPDEEPEEDLSVDQMEEKAKAGDARAQTRVSESTCKQAGTWHCFQSCWLTQSGCEHLFIFGHLEDDTRLLI